MIRGTGGRFLSFHLSRFQSASSVIITDLAFRSSLTEALLTASVSSAGLPNQENRHSLQAGILRARRFAEANWPGQHFPVYNDPVGVIILWLFEKLFQNPLIPFIWFSSLSDLEKYTPSCFVCRTHRKSRPAPEPVLPGQPPVRRQIPAGNRAWPLYVFSS